MNVFSNQQLVAKEDAVKAFRLEAICWVILLAQMQSGKTETFLLIACELLYNSLVDNVVIFSGNAETDLKSQLLEQVKNSRSGFFKKYKKYLRTIIDDEDERDDLIDSHIAKIQVVWGSEMDSYAGPTERTLFIWEEAHHAQSKHQRPDKFLNRIGVSADGNTEYLQRNNNLMMTISATPFSELSDNLHFGQYKHVVKMQPGDGYVSVKHIRDSGRIRLFRGKETGLTEALNLPRCGKKYGIVRVSHKNEDTVKSTIESNGWKWVVYDSVSPSRKEREDGEKAWRGMGTEPKENTVILIRGKCRMGKNLEKSHLLFVFETSKKSNTDTVLQSLLGRVCGYSAGSDRVIVYLSEKIVLSGEIDRYIELWERDGVQILPTQAKNLTDKKVKYHIPIVPIRIQIDRNKYPTNDRSHLLMCIRESFTTSSGISNKNSESAYKEVRQKAMTSNSKFLNAHYIDPKKEHQVIRIRNVIDSYIHSIARDFGSGGGIDSESTQIKYWIAKKGVIGVDPNVMYITAHVIREDMDAFNIPATTGKEVFAHRLEDGSEEHGNGGMTIRLSSHTANNDAVMSSELCKMIDISLSTQGCERKIASCWDDNEKEFKGILVTPSIYEKLQKGGSIYKHIFAQYGIKLHTCKSSGRVSKSIESRGFIKLASISW